MAMVDWALKYNKEYSFNVFPVIGKGQPLGKYSEWFDKKQTQEDVKELWTRNPDANIGILTGKINDLTVVDFDTYKLSDKEKEELNEALPPIATPTVFTPSGGQHKYFKYNPDIPHQADILKAVDGRNDGGYIIAPPSKNGGANSYVWEKKASINNTSIRSLPDVYIKSLIYKTNTSIYNTSNSKIHASQHQPTNANIANMVNFRQGGRDQTLFHLANTLLKGGMSNEEIEQYLLFVAKNCNPPFPEKEVRMKILSALKRNEGQVKNLTAELREMLSANMGATISLQYAYNCQHVQHKADKKKIQSIFSRFNKDGLIERTGRVAGEYRVLDSQCQPTNFKAAFKGGIDIRYPMGAERFFHTMPKNIIIFTGVKDTGKTALALNLIHLNQNRPGVLPIKYFSNEFGGAEMQGRLSLFEDVPLDDWNFDFYERKDNYGDVIGKDCINIIDYLELLDNFYLIGKKISEIWEKLDKGVAIIFLQKDKGKDIARGGHTSLDRARAYFVIDPDFPGQKIRIEAMKNWKDPMLNPKGYTRDYKLAKGCKIIPENDWYLE